MDITGWEYFYKIYDGRPQPTNLLYTPLVNPEGTIMCMLWDETSPYQSENTRLTKELIDFFFERELTHLKEFQGLRWAPKLLEVDGNKIFIEWNKETLNQIVFTPGRSLDQECPDWREQILFILEDIVDLGYYKMALYPHCFYLDKNKKVKTFDYYSCLSQTERYLERSKIAGMIGNDSGGRFDEATTEGLVDFDLFFKRTLSEHLSKAWPDNPFPQIYKALYG